MSTYMKNIKQRYEEAEMNIYQILDEYKPNDSIFDEDDELIKKLKKIIYTKLDETDKRIILEYAEIGNSRDCAKLFKVSPTTIYLRIKEIQNKIKSYLENECNN